MTAFDRFDDRFGARLSDALDDLATPQFPDYFDDVLGVALAGRQRPAWTFAERWIPMSTLARRQILALGVPVRLILAALLLLTMLVAGAIVSGALRSDDVPQPFGPAANGLIAYQANDDIYTRDLVTGEERLIVGGPERDVGPMFSRDGQWVGWLRLDPDGSDSGTVMVARADGSDARALTDPIEVWWASWSPDSDSIAAVAATPGEDAAMMIIPIDPNVGPSTVALPVTPDGFVEWRPPDGDELVFLGADGNFRAVYGVRPDGTGFRQISEDGGPAEYRGDFALTPDGSRMLYSAGSSVHVRILDLESGEIRPFGAALPEPPGWDGEQQYSGAGSILPGGETIVFGRYWNESGGEINHQLWTGSLDGDGADAVPLGAVHRSRSGHNPFWQAVAPDGMSILIVENETGEAWLTDPDGATVEAVELRQLGDPPSWQRLAP